MSDRVYIGVPEVVARYSGALSKFSIYELTRTGRIPHRRLQGSSKLLFLADELASWEDGCLLECVESNGGRVVRPVGRPS